MRRFPHASDYRRNGRDTQEGWDDEKRPQENWHGFEATVSIWRRNGNWLGRHCVAESMEVVWRYRGVDEAAKSSRDQSGVIDRRLYDSIN